MMIIDKDILKQSGCCEQAIKEFEAYYLYSPYYPQIPQKVLILDCIASGKGMYIIWLYQKYRDAFIQAFGKPNNIVSSHNCTLLDSLTIAGDITIDATLVATKPIIATGNIRAKEINTSNHIYCGNRITCSGDIKCCNLFANRGINAKNIRCNRLETQELYAEELNCRNKPNVWKYNVKQPNKWRSRDGM